MGLRLGFYGFGSIARLTARMALERGHELGAIVDIDPSLVGRDAGEILGLGERLGVAVSKDPGVFRGVDVVVHATGSYLDRVYPQILAAIDSGADVVSTCETLSYPYYRYPTLASLIDSRARSRGVSVIGTGINPGFLLDSLVVTLAASVGVVSRVVAVRSLDAAERRLPFQRKIGVGLDPGEAREKLERGELTGHVGYAESVYLIAHASGLRLDKVVEGQDVVPAERDVESRGVSVPRGKNLGVKGYGAGYVGDSEVIRVELHAYVGAGDYEEVRIEYDEGTLVWRSTGTHGDRGTASIILSVAEDIPGREPGLLLMTDLLPFHPRFR
jgi:hypothetical protein